MNTNTNNPNKEILRHCKRGFIKRDSVIEYMKSVNKLLFQLGFWDGERVKATPQGMQPVGGFELRVLMTEKHKIGNSLIRETVDAMEAAEYYIHQEIDEVGFFIGKGYDEVSHDIDEIIVYKDDDMEPACPSEATHANCKHSEDMDVRAFTNGIEVGCSFPFK